MQYNLASEMILCRRFRSKRKPWAKQRAHPHHGLALPQHPLPPPPPHTHLPSIVVSLSGLPVDVTVITATVSRVLNHAPSKPHKFTRTLVSKQILARVHTQTQTKPDKRRRTRRHGLCTEGAGAYLGVEGGGRNTAQSRQDGPSLRHRRRFAFHIS